MFKGEVRGALPEREQVAPEDMPMSSATRIGSLNLLRRVLRRVLRAILGGRGPKQVSPQRHNK